MIEMHEKKKYSRESEALQRQSAAWGFVGTVEHQVELVLLNLMTAEQAVKNIHDRLDTLYSFLDWEKLTDRMAAEEREKKNV